MHLCNVLAGHGFDYKAMVVAGQEAIPEAALGVAVERGASRQGVLERGKQRDGCTSSCFMLHSSHHGSVTQ